MLINIDHLPSACLICDSQGEIVFVNSELLRLTGFTMPDLLNRNMEVLLTSGSKVFFQTHLWPTLRKDGNLREIFVHLQSVASGRLPLYVNAHLTLVEGQTRYIWLFYAWAERSQFEAELVEARRQALTTAEQIRDAHERLARLHEQLEQKVTDTEARYLSATELAHVDSLTQLGNRRSLQVAAKALSSDKAPPGGYSVLMIDIDHFKKINDQYGHDRGDRVLQSVAKCIQGSARQGDTAVRYGGEEFSLVLPGTDTPQAARVAERIHRDIRAARPDGLEITVSIGVATSSAADSDLYSVLKRADEALYTAKQRGRNQSAHHGDQA